jgi:hypothetical protein
MEKKAAAAAHDADTNKQSTAFTLFEKHRREFERTVGRLEKVDKYNWFWDDAPDEFDAKYGGDTNAKFPDHAPFNWEMIKRRHEHGPYGLNRENQEGEERFKVLAPCYTGRGKWLKRRFEDSSAAAAKKLKKRKPNRRVINPHGVDWDLSAQDAYNMIQAAVERNSKDSHDPDDKQGVLCAARKVREAIQQAVEKRGRRHEREMRDSDDRHKFALIIDKSRNHEAAIQSWCMQPFPERGYERLQSNCAFAGLSKLDLMNALRHMNS